MDPAWAHNPDRGEILERRFDRSPRFDATVPEWLRGRSAKLEVVCSNQTGSSKVFFDMLGNSFFCGQRIRIGTPGYQPGGWSLNLYGRSHFHF